jgi:hypothetical protein
LKSFYILIAIVAKDLSNSYTSWSIPAYVLLTPNSCYRAPFFHGMRPLRGERIYERVISSLAQASAHTL